MTPSVLEAHNRSKRFHAEIARRASLVPQREERTYFIPNVPFGVRKINPMLPVRKPEIVCVEYYYQFMWFHDLVNFKPGTTARIRITDIQTAVCRKYHIDLAELLADRRFGPLVRARQIAVYLAKKLTLQSLPEIGRRFGGRDHTTILHSVRKIESLLLKDLVLQADVAALTAELRA